jgi:hypothetical protein
LPFVVCGVLILFEIVSFRLWRLGIRTGSGVRSKTQSNSLQMLTKSQSDVEFKLPERIKPEVNSSLL